MKTNSLRLKLWGLLVVAGLIGSAQLIAQTDVTDTYLTNAGFDINCNYLATADSTNLGTTDGSTNVDSVSSWNKQVTGWSAASSFEYGYPGTLNSPGPVPATAFDGTTTGGTHGCLGVSVAWSGVVTYYQEVTLPAGSYKLSYNAFNSGSSAYAASQVGWVPDAGTSSLSSLTDFTQDAWTSDEVNFSVETETSGIIQVGFAAQNAGSGGNGRIFFDDLKLEYTPVVLSDDATLSDLTTDEGSLAPSFDANTMSYTLTVSEATTSVAIGATANDANASVDGSGDIDLTSGDTSLMIVVTAENGNTKNYFVNISTSTNLIEWWDGNGKTGDYTAANVFGWQNDAVGTNWGNANAGGVRYMDVNNHTLGDGSTYTGRVLLARWDYGGDFPGSTYAYPVYLTGSCSSYVLTGLYEWWNNGALPTYRFAVSDAPEGGNIVAYADYMASETKNQLLPFELTFNIPAEGVYYIQVTEAAGGNSLIGLADLDLATNNEETLSTSVSGLEFDKLNLEKSFTVSGNALTNDVSLTAPAGISLDVTSIAAGDAQCGVTVTATFDNSANIMDTIKVVSGTMTKDIVVTAWGPLSFNEGEEYYIVHDVSGLVLGEDETNQGVKIYAADKDSTDQIFVITESNRPGEYFIKNQETGYLALSPANTWSMMYIADTITTSDSCRFFIKEYEPGMFYLESVIKGGKLVGTDGTGAGSSAYCDKPIRDLSVWRIEKAVYVLPAELAHSYNFEEADTAIDVIGGANGTLKGNAAVADGKYTASADGDYIKLPAKDIAINTYDAVTLEAYVTTGVNPSWTMFGYFGSVNGANSYWMSIARDDDVSKTAINIGGEEGPTGVEPGADESHHYVSVLTNDTLKWYIDGVMVNKTATSASHVISAISLDTALIGASGYGDATWNGTIYEFNIYNGILSEDSIAAHANQFVDDFDASLSDITLSDGDLVPGFSTSVKEYVVSIPTGVTTITLTGTPTIAGAEVVDGDVDVSSGSASDTIKVTSVNGAITTNYIVYFTTNNESCFEPIGENNLVTDPEVTDIGNFGGWGTQSINVNPEYVYCGLTSGKIETSGSIDVPLTLKPNTVYRVIAQVYIVSGEFRIGVAANDVELTAPTNTTTGQWETMDFEVSTGDNVGASQLMYFNNYNLTGTVGYIDNWEMYELKGVGVHKLNNKEEISVYPTVSSDVFTVEFANEPGMITVYNLSGKVVKQVVPSSSKERISIEGTGLYIIKAESAGASKLFKVVKTN
ncbi:LamG-like jellyroll fold domain-containing protein [Saccharicrinis sp. FJH2]|uniref:LamG-like jellyroll fold domain-containing protein n=1 Tax=Saccharicrinis sp. FJH65 TaxID=3344659 RepID=UPI0035F46E62